jgi:hypothetical protein
VIARLNFGHIYLWLIVLNTCLHPSACPLVGDIFHERHRDKEAKISILYVPHTSFNRIQVRKYPQIFLPSSTRRE